MYFYTIIWTHILWLKINLKMNRKYKRFQQNKKKLNYCIVKRKNENLKYESKEKKPNTLTPSSLGKPVSKPKKPSAILVLKLEQLMSYD